MGKFFYRILLLFLTLFQVCIAQVKIDTTDVRRHLIVLTQTEVPRNYEHVEQLNVVADYIRNVFAAYSDSVYFQEYVVDGKIYKNVICSFGREYSKRVIIGAHYDVCGNQPGADDNASGVTALLELAKHLQYQKLSHRVDLVAFTLEEPPYFRSEYMGSYVHAKYLADNKMDVFGMLSVEMIGYFSDEKKSQHYPVALLSLFYGNKGNYITLVKKWGAGKFARKFCRYYKKENAIRTKKFAAPRSVPGIDYSDHLNYWKFGFSALMITDTSFYRNHHYHKNTDTVETLDITRMSKVIEGIFKVVISL
jgi:Peptidase family M28